MTVAAATTAGALLGGLLVYTLFLLVLPDVDITALGSLVGLAALLAGAGAGAWAARRSRAAADKATPARGASRKAAGKQARR